MSEITDTLTKYSADLIVRQIIRDIINEMVKDVIKTTEISTGKLKTKLKPSETQI